MPKPTVIPTWATDSGAAITEPSAGKKGTGWLVGEAPPAEYFNWLQRYTGQWCSYLNGLHAEAATWTALQTFSAGAAVPAAEEFRYVPARTYRAHSLPHEWHLRGGLVFIPGSTYDLVYSGTGADGTLHARLMLPGAAVVTALRLGMTNTTGGAGSLPFTAHKLVRTTAAWSAVNVASGPSAPVALNFSGWLDLPLVTDEATRTMTQDGALRLAVTLPATVGEGGWSVLGLEAEYTLTALRPVT